MNFPILLTRVWYHNYRVVKALRAQIYWIKHNKNRSFRAPMVLEKWCARTATTAMVEPKNNDNWAVSGKNPIAGTCTRNMESDSTLFICGCNLNRPIRHCAGLGAEMYDADETPYSPRHKNIFWPSKHRSYASAAELGNSGTALAFIFPTSNYSRNTLKLGGSTNLMWSIATCSQAWLKR